MPPYIKAAADVYSEELATLGHGRAMWHPEPVREQGDIEIGDVGFVEAG